MIFRTSDSDKPFSGGYLENRKSGELKILYQFLSLLEELPSRDELFQNTVEMIPFIYGDPLSVCARIIFDSVEFTTPNFNESRIRQVHDIYVEGNVRGVIEVFLVSDGSVLNPDPSSKFDSTYLFRENYLLNRLAASLGLFVERTIKDAEVRTFKRIADEANYGIAIVDMDGRLSYVNEKLVRMHGYSTEEVTGNNFLMFYDDDQLPRIKYLFRKMLEMGNCEKEEVWNVRQDKSVFPAMLNGSIIYDSNDEPLYMSITLINITEHKKSEEALIFARKMAETANRSKSEFLANVSHELRTPLNSIIGFSDVLISQRPGPVNDMQKKYLSNVSRNGKNLLNILNGILEISLIESGNMKLTYEHFPSGSVISSMVTASSSSLSEKGLKLECHIPSGLPDIYADHSKFKQIIGNLLSNAIKFSLKDGHIQIRARRVENMIHYTVKDNGIGIPRENMPHLYDKFYQVDGSIRRKYGGTGLGLTISKKLVELHKGTMWIISEEGVGTVANVMLPIIPEQ